MFTDLASSSASVPAATAEGTPISTIIRQRLQDAGQRFHANDNIAAFLNPHELEQLLDEVAEKNAGRARQFGD